MKHVKVENIEKHKFLVYTLDQEEILDPVILGMMQNNTIRGLLPLRFLQKDDQQILNYDISKTIILSEFIKCDSDGMKLVLILKDLADILLGAREYMIEETAFLFGLHSVFVGSDGKGRLICLPVENRDGMTFRQFCFQLLRLPVMAGRCSKGALSQVYAYLNSKTFSVRDFSAMLDKLELRSAVTSFEKSPKETAVLQKSSGPVILGKKDRIRKSTKLADQVQKARQSSIGHIFNPKQENTGIRGYFYRKSSKEKIEIDRPLFRIGKSREHAEYCISDNPSISRLHAAVIRQGDIFSIEDTNSLNHTYVNQQMLREGQRVKLENGTAIRLSNEEFIFLTEKD